MDHIKSAIDIRRFNLEITNLESWIPTTFHALPLLLCTGKLL